MKKANVKLLFALALIVVIPVMLVILHLWYFGWIVWRRYWQFMNLGGLITAMREGFYSRLNVPDDSPTKVNSN